jgi:hypothetical protein
LLRLTRRFLGCKGGKEVLMELSVELFFLFLGLPWFLVFGMGGFGVGGDGRGEDFGFWI